MHFISFEMGSIDVPEIHMHAVYQFERESCTCMGVRSRFIFG